MEDLKGVYLYKTGKRLLEESNITKLKALIKEQVQPPTENKKVYIVNYIYNETSKFPFKIIIAQYTLTPTLSLVIKDGDNSQTITYTNDEIQKYKFKENIISKIIKLIKLKKLDYKKLSIPITDIMDLI
jgi:hypothetical protein